MKTSEEIIHQALTGLRDTQAPTGLEDRVLQALQDRASSTSVWRWWRPLERTTRSWAWGVAVAGVAVAFLSLTVSSAHRRGHGTADSKRQPISEKAQPMSAQNAVAVEHVPVSTPHGMSTKRVAARREAQKVQSLSGEDAIALSEMRAPSHPAPKMPLTEQEKLMLRIVRGGDPVELAELDPRVRDAQYAQQKAEFKNFFEPPRTGDKE